MKFIRTEISDVIICEPKVLGDERGYFVETFRQDKLEEFIGCKINFRQDNESKSSYGVLRGLHYQLAPYAQTKLVRVIEGHVLDIAVDIRKGSPTFGKYVAVELTGENKKQLLIPRGFAHGYLVLSEKAILAYKVDNYYNQEYDRGLAFDDKTIGVDWGIAMKKMRFSSKDKNLPKFQEIVYFDYKTNLYE